MAESAKPRHGRVITRFGAEMIIEDDTGGLHRATGRRRLDKAVCGDFVQWETSGPSDVVTAILPRCNALTRPDLRGRPKAIAANIDQILITSAYMPEPNWEMVDRYLVAAERLAAHGVIVMNKADLKSTPDPHADVLSTYSALGYPVISTSVKEPSGLEDLQLQCAGHTSILVGLSGVGKSSLIQALHPEEDIRIGQISESLGRGRHTTTNATLYHLPGGGSLIDSPGVRDFDLGAVEPDLLARGFVEFAEFSMNCRFHNCSHTVEPGCAIVAAAETGEIDARRYASYRALLRNLRDSHART